MTIPFIPAISHNRKTNGYTVKLHLKAPEFYGLYQCEVVSTLSTLQHILQQNQLQK